MMRSVQELFPSWVACEDIEYKRHCTCSDRLTGGCCELNSIHMPLLTDYGVFGHGSTTRMILALCYKGPFEICHRSNTKYF